MPSRETLAVILERPDNQILRLTMTDWYRRKTWTKTDEEEYFAKLGRARKDGRAQYLRVQAIELIETKDPNLLSVAETLLNKILTDYPENRIEKSQTLNSLGEIYKLREDYETALNYFQKSLDFEKEFPNVITTAYLNFSETVVRAEKTELYDKVENLLTEKINENTLKFPVQNYIMYSVMTVISEYKGDFAQTRIYSDLAEKNATTQTNSLWNPQKKKIGIVKDRIKWLDKVVGRK
jgi:tetratricopeptide (TPR) repeat protein